MNPNLKQVHRAMQREFCKNRKSEKYKKLKIKFKKMKRKAIKKFYSNFITELKNTNPGKWYRWTNMAKHLGAVDQMTNGEVEVECLAGVDNSAAAQIIAQHFSSVSNEYSPVDLTQLPSYLPALPPPVVEEYDVYQN